MISSDHHEDTTDIPEPVKRGRKKRSDEEGLKKAPDAPKRFKSSYICFSVANQQKIKEELGPGARVADISKKIAELWKNLDSEERKKWDQAAEADKQRYMEEKAAYKGPWQIASHKRAKKDPSAPKRPCSAFLYFSQKYRSIVKQENPDMKNIEVSKKLGEMWRNSSEEEKASYVNKEKKERLLYKSAIADWREKHAVEEAEKKKKRAEEAAAEKRRVAAANKARKKAKVEEDFLREKLQMPQAPAAQEQAQPDLQQMLRQNELAASLQQGAVAQGSQLGQSLSDAQTAMLSSYGLGNSLAQRYGYGLNLGDAQSQLAAAAGIGYGGEGLQAASGMDAGGAAGALMGAYGQGMGVGAFDGGGGLYGGGGASMAALGMGQSALNAQLGAYGLQGASGLGAANLGNVGGGVYGGYNAAAAQQMLQNKGFQGFPGAGGGF